MVKLLGIEEYAAQTNGTPSFWDKEGEGGCCSCVDGLGFCTVHIYIGITGAHHTMHPRVIS